MSTEERLAAIEARANAATPAPWDADAHWSGDGFVVMADGLRRAHVPDLRDLPGAESQAGNAEFIAAARQDVPALAAALRAVLALCDEYDLLDDEHAEIRALVMRNRVDVRLTTVFCESVAVTRRR